MALTPASLRVEGLDGRAAEEYRIRDGRIELRLLRSEDPDPDCAWRSLSSQDLSAHVMRNTIVAQWLKHRLGWRRLLQACVAEDCLWQGMPDHTAHDRRAG